MRPHYADFGVTPMMLTASFSVHRLTREIVFIVDECERSGGMSVTNAAEYVCFDCWRRFGNRRIVYRDTAGQWDELLHDRGRFRGFTPYPPPA